MKTIQTISITHSLIKIQTYEIPETTNNTFCSFITCVKATHEQLYQ